MRLTKKAYEIYLNELGVPRDEKWSNGGRIKNSIKKYGTWLRNNDPVMFNVGYNEWKIDQKYRRGL
jgi:hypothetical protein